MRALCARRGLNGKAEERGQTRVNLRRGGEGNIGVEEELDKSMKLRFSRFIIGPYPDTVHCVL